jgi:hypothetical protein
MQQKALGVGPVTGERVRAWHLPLGSSSSSSSKRWGAMCYQQHGVAVPVARERGAGMGSHMKQ